MKILSYVAAAVGTVQVAASKAPFLTPAELEPRVASTADCPVCLHSAVILKHYVEDNFQFLTDNRSVL